MNTTNPVLFTYLLGPNSCGKGTVARILREGRGVHTETMSDVLNEEKETNPSLASTIKHYKDVLHKNVPCEIVIPVFMKRVRKVFQAEQVKPYFVGDGVGRTVTQLQEITDQLWILKPHMRIGAVFLKLSQRGVLERMQSRIDQRKAAKLPPRKDDNPKSAIDRYMEYQENESELIECADDILGGNIVIYNLDHYPTDKVADFMWNRFQEPPSRPRTSHRAATAG